MKIKKIRALMAKYAKTLNSDEKDEWWGTDKGIWREMSAKFLKWCEKNRAEIEGGVSINTQQP